MTPKKKLEPSQDQPESGKSALERMTDLTRRIVAVPKSELPATKLPSRKHQ